MANKLQWVNLSKDAVFVEDEVSSKEYLEYVHFEAKFSKAKAASFKVRVVEKGKPATYTAKEKARNPHFKQRHTRSQTNLGKTSVKAEEKVYLPAAGGNEYEIEALYRRKVIKGKQTRETRRKIYYQAISMVGVSIPGLGPTESYYEKLFVVLKNKGGAGQISYLQNIDDNEKTQRDGLIKLAKGAYKIDKYKPWAFAVAFVDMIGARTVKQYQSPVLNAPSKLLSVFSSTVSFTIPDGDYLWFGVEPKDDAQNGGKGLWLFDETYWVDAAGTPHKIDMASVTIDKKKKRKGPRGGYNTLKIDIPSSLKKTFTSSQGHISIKVCVLEGFSGGYSENSINFIVVAKSGWWKDNSDTVRLQILNHEMGHKLGMVQDGIGRRLDPPPTLYGHIRNGPKANNKGHAGPHCEKGANYNGARWTGTPGCVMFGATACVDAARTVHATPSTYCGECEKIVRKLDLDGRMLRGFKTSIATY